jgi:hypothetical protein
MCDLFRWAVGLCSHQLFAIHKFTTSFLPGVVPWRQHAAGSIPAPFMVDNRGRPETTVSAILNTWVAKLRHLSRPLDRTPSGSSDGTDFRVWDFRCGEVSCFVWAFGIMQATAIWKLMSLLTYADRITRTAAGFGFKRLLDLNFISYIFGSRDSLATGWTFRVWFPEWQHLSLLHSVQTGPGFHPTFYLMGTGVDFLGGKASGAWSWPVISI